MGVARDEQAPGGVGNDDEIRLFGRNKELKIGKIMRRSVGSRVYKNKSH